MATFNDNGFVKTLNNNEFIVVGTNELGEHYGGAAQQAHKEFGAIWGEARGVLGSHSYGIVTLNEKMEKVDVDDLKAQAVHLKRVANNNPDKRFYLTPVGTGIAGFPIGVIENVFGKLPGNVIKVGWL